MTLDSGAANPLGPRTFSSAIAICFSRYFQFSDRAPRSEYWFFILFLAILTLAADILDAVVFGSLHEFFGAVVALGTFIPNLAVLVRRLHDVDRSGWWALLLLVVVIGWIILLIWTCTAGTRGPNRFGPDPLGSDRGS